MKKLIAMFIALITALSVAYADIPDISGLSFNELLALRAEVNKAMMESDNYQEVTVPQGIYEVGKDIPAGSWTIRCADASKTDYLLSSCRFSWGSNKPDSGYYFSYMDRKGDVEIYNPKHKRYEKGQITEIHVDLVDGEFVIIHPQYAPATFCTYIGKTDLGFK